MPNGLFHETNSNSISKRQNSSNGKSFHMVLKVFIANNVWLNDLFVPNRYFWVPIIVEEKFIVWLKQSIRNVVRIWTNKSRSIEVKLLQKVYILSSKTKYSLYFIFETLINFWYLGSCILVQFYFFVSVYVCMGMRGKGEGQRRVNIFFHPYPMISCINIVWKASSCIDHTVYQRSTIEEIGEWAGCKSKLVGKIL